MNALPHDLPGSWRMELSGLLLLLAISGNSVAMTAATPTTSATPATMPANQAYDGPRGGWNYAGLTDRSTDATVSYPTPPILRGQTRSRRPIKGTIPKNDQHDPHLIVNGNALRLNTDKDGHFERYYAFGKGSNSIDVRADRSKPGHRVQFYEANPIQATPHLRIVCSWDAPEAEVDLHIITPDRQHVAYWDPVMKDGGGLDIDSVDGPGPEMFTDATPQHGTYMVYVNYYGNIDDESGYTFDQSKLKKPIVTATISLITDENTPKEKRESFVVPLRKIGELNLVKTFIY